MKVYIVIRHYDNDESYEEYYSYNANAAVCATRESAEKYIAEVEEKGFTECENPHPDFFCDCERCFASAIGEYAYYTIEEMDLLV